MTNLSGSVGLNNAPNATDAAGGGGKQVKVEERNVLSPAKSDYYYNDKRVWKAGHEMEFDSTENNRRIRIAHASGTNFEYTDDGRKVENIKSHEHKYIQGGATLTVDNNSDYKFNGNVRLSVGKGAHMEINGKSSIAVSKELAITLGKSASIITVDNLHIASKNITFTSDEDMNFKARGIGFKAKDGFHVNAKQASVSTSGEFAVEANDKQVKLEFKDKDASLETKSGKIVAKATKDMELNSKQNIVAEAKQKIKNTGKSGVEIAGSTIDLNQA